MRLRDRLAARSLLLCAAAIAVAPALAAEAPRFGQPISPGDLASYRLRLSDS